MDHVVCDVAGHATSAPAVYLFSVRMCPRSELAYAWNSCFRLLKSRLGGFVFAPWEKWCEWTKPAKERGSRRSMNSPDLSVSVVQSQTRTNAKTAEQEALIAKCSRN